MFISRVIFEGDRSLNAPSTPSWLSFTLLHPPPPLHHHPRSRPLHLKFACRPGRDPLPSIEGCGFDFDSHRSLTSEDAAPSRPSPFQRDVGGLASLDSGSGEGGRRGESTKWEAVRNTSHDICCGSFSPISSSTQLMSLIPQRQVSTEMTASSTPHRKPTM